MTSQVCTHARTWSHVYFGFTLRHLLTVGMPALQQTVQLWLVRHGLFVPPLFIG